jgi:hypothetical protein
MSDVLPPSHATSMSALQYMVAIRQTRSVLSARSSWIMEMAFAQSKCYRIAIVLMPCPINLGMLEHGCKVDRDGKCDAYDDSFFRH